MLTDDHKTKWMDSVPKILTRYTQEGDGFLDTIVNGDETWVFHHTPQSKQQSLERRHTLSARTRKFNTSISVKKIMASVFWDRNGIVLFDFMASVFWNRKGIPLFDFMPPGATINAAAYFDTLTWLRRAIQNKRKDMSRGLCLLHDTRGTIPPT
jgi:hypothetical protein